MIGNIDQIQDRWQKVEADRPPEQRRERPLFGKAGRRKSRHGDADSRQDSLDNSHLDIRA